MEINSVVDFTVKVGMRRRQEIGRIVAHNGDLNVVHTESGDEFKLADSDLVVVKYDPDDPDIVELWRRNCWTPPA